MAFQNELVWSSYESLVICMITQGLNLGILLNPKTFSIPAKTGHRLF